MLASGCAIMGSKSAKDKRAIVMDMKEKVLHELYKSKPHTRSLIEKSTGYGVFSNANVNVVIASFGGGYGVIKNNKTGRSTYMRVGEVGIGFGLGMKDFRAIIIFHNQKTLNQFVNEGWNIGGHVDAAAKAGDKGAAVGGEALASGNMTIYQITKTGLALQATLKGTRYWKDPELN